MNRKIPIHDDKSEATTQINVMLEIVRKAPERNFVPYGTVPVIDSAKTRTLRDSNSRLVVICDRLKLKFQNFEQIPQDNPDSLFKPPIMLPMTGLIIHPAGPATAIVNRTRWIEQARDFLAMLDAVSPTEALDELNGDCSRANTFVSFDGTKPTSAVRNLAFKLAERGPVSERKIALDFTGGDREKADSLLAQIRRLKREGRIIFKPDP